MAITALSLSGCASVQRVPFDSLAVGQAPICFIGNVGEPRARWVQMAVHAALDTTVELLEAQRPRVEGSRLPQVFTEGLSACRQASESVTISVVVEVNLKRDRVKVRLGDKETTVVRSLDNASRRGAELAIGSSCSVPNCDYERFVRAALQEQVKIATSEFWKKYEGG